MIKNRHFEKTILAVAVAAAEVNISKKTILAVAAAEVNKYFRKFVIECKQKSIDDKTLNRFKLDEFFFPQEKKNQTVNY